MSNWLDSFSNGVVFPGRRMNSRTTSLAMKMFQNTSKTVYDFGTVFCERSGLAFLPPARKDHAVSPCPTASYKNKILGWTPATFGKRSHSVLLAGICRPAPLNTTPVCCGSHRSSALMNSQQLSTHWRASSCAQHIRRMSGLKDITDRRTDRRTGRQAGRQTENQQADRHKDILT